MAAETKKDAGWGVAADDFLGCSEGRGGQKVLGLGKVPAKDALVARRVGEAGRTEVEAFCKDNSGVVVGVEKGGVGEMVPRPGFEQGEIRRKGDREAARRKGAADEGSWKGGDDGREPEVSNGGRGGGGGIAWGIVEANKV